MTGLTVGAAYGFDVPFTTFWRGPGYPDSDGIMKKQVGIDPLLSKQSQSAGEDFVLGVHVPDESHALHWPLHVQYIS